MGITLREVIYDIGGGIQNGKKFKAVQIGGPSGGCLTEKQLDSKLDFDSLAKIGAMIGSGGLVIMDEQYLYGRSSPVLYELYAEMNPVENVCHAEKVQRECWRFLKES